MPERWGGLGSGPRRTGFRPPWWPEGEPFPGRGVGSGHGIRRRFLRRAALLFAGLIGLLIAANALALTLLSRSLGPGRHHGSALPVAILGLVLLAIALVVIARVVRRM